MKKYRNEKLEPYVEGEAYFEIDRNNDKFWHNAENQLHREDGPSIEYDDGSKCWYFQNQCHREDGPAIEYASGIKYWYIEGINYSESDFKIALEVYCVKVGKKSIFTLQREAEEEKRREYWRTVEMPGEYSYIEL